MTYTVVLRKSFLGEVEIINIVSDYLGSNAPADDFDLVMWLIDDFVEKALPGSYTWSSLTSELLADVDEPLVLGEDTIKGIFNESIKNAFEAYKEERWS